MYSTPFFTVHGFIKKYKLFLVLS